MRLGVRAAALARHESADPRPAAAPRREGPVNGSNSFPQRPGEGNGEGDSLLREGDSQLCPVWTEPTVPHPTHRATGTTAPFGRGSIRGAKGITLLEMMVVVALLGLIAGLTYPSVSRGMERIRLRVAADEVASFMALAMNRVERTELPIELRFVKARAAIEMEGPNTPLRTLRLPDGVRLSEVYPISEDGFVAQPSILLLPGGAFPDVTVELSTRSAGKRTVRIDPVTGAPSIQTILPAPVVAK